MRSPSGEGTSGSYECQDEEVPYCAGEQGREQGRIIII